MVKTNPMINVEAKVLKQLKNLHRLSASQLDGLARNLKVMIFKKDEIIFDQDEQADLVYLLVHERAVGGHDVQLEVLRYCHQPLALRPQPFRESPSVAARFARDRCRPGTGSGTDGRGLYLCALLQSARAHPRRRTSDRPKGRLHRDSVRAS